MPRGKQGVKVAQGLPYGQGEEMAAAQRAIPLPDNRTAPSQAPPMSIGSQGSPNQNAPGPGGNLEQAIAAAAQAPDPLGGLADPTNRPGEPITAGLPVGAGPGPQAVAQSAQQRASVASFFALASEVFGGDPLMADMAQRAQRRGL